MLATLTDGSLSEDEVGRRELDVSSSVQLGEELEGLQCSWDGQSMLPLMKKSPALLEGHLNDVCLEGVEERSGRLVQPCHTCSTRNQNGSESVATQI